MTNERVEPSPGGASPTDKPGRAEEGILPAFMPQALDHSWRARRERPRRAAPFGLPPEALAETHALCLYSPLQVPNG